MAKPIHDVINSCRRQFILPPSPREVDLLQAKTEGVTVFGEKGGRCGAADGEVLLSHLHVSMTLLSQ